MRLKMLVMMVGLVIVFAMSVLASLVLVIFYEQPPSFWSENATECRRDIDCTVIVRGCYNWSPINKKHKALLKDRQLQLESAQSEFIQDSPDVASEEANGQQRFTDVVTFCSASTPPGPKPPVACQNNVCILLESRPTWLEILRGYFWEKDYSDTLPG